MLKEFIPKTRQGELIEFAKKHLTKVDQDDFMRAYESTGGESYNVFLLINYTADHINAIAFEDYSPSIPFEHIYLRESHFKRLHENARFYFKTLYDVELTADFDEHSFKVSFTPDKASNRYDWEEIDFTPPLPRTDLPEL